MHNVILSKKHVEKQINLKCSKENNKDENSMFLNRKSNSETLITKMAHHNVSSRSCKDLSLETKKLLMSHCFAERQAEMPTSSIEFVVHPAFFPSILLVIITLTLHILGKGDMDNNEGGFTLEIGVSKFWVTISRCSIKTGDIIEVGLYMTAMNFAIFDLTTF